MYTNGCRFFIFFVVFNITSVIGEPVPKSTTRFHKILYNTFTASYKIDQIFQSTINVLFKIYYFCIRGASKLVCGVYVSASGTLCFAAGFTLKRMLINCEEVM